MPAFPSAILRNVCALLLLASIVDLATASPAARRQFSNGYTDPAQNGGSLLSRISTSTSLGEPLNVIISGDSDAQVLTATGVSEYFGSLFFSPGDCFGISEGTAQQANLGDGRGYLNQTDVLRFNYYQGDGGTCLESLKGGNHLRYWTQNGTQANTSAIFIAASVEYPASQNHMIVPNGYGLGRDWLTGNATNSSGTTSPGGFHYSTTLSQASLLQSVDQSDINHGISVDGTVHILTVRVIRSGQTGVNQTSTSGSAQSGAAYGPHLTILWAIALPSFLLAIALLVLV